MLRTAGPEAPEPVPPWGVVMMIGCSWVYGANHEVVCLPWTSAVPVLACIGILSCGQPPNRQAAVPRVATPASAWSVWSRVLPLNGSLPWDLGLISWMCLPSWLTIALPMLGL